MAVQGRSEGPSEPPRPISRWFVRALTVTLRHTPSENMRGIAVGARLSGNRLGRVTIPALVDGVVGPAALGAVFLSIALMLPCRSVLCATAGFPLRDELADGAFGFGVCA